MNFHIAAALDRLRSEENPEVRGQIINDTLSVLTAMLPIKIVAWDAIQVLQVGIRMGAAAAFVIAEDTQNAIHELEELNGYFAEQGVAHG